jgi:hypothetical protein
MGGDWLLPFMPYDERFRSTTFNVTLLSTLNQFSSNAKALPQTH